MAKETNENTVYCACCGYITLEYGIIAEVCPICFWSCDFDAENDITIPSFVNWNLTLNEAKENFEKFGAIKERYINKVLPYEARKFYKHINDEDE